MNDVIEILPFHFGPFTERMLSKPLFPFGLALSLQDLPRIPCERLNGNRAAVAKEEIKRRDQNRSPTAWSRVQQLAGAPFSYLGLHRPRGASLPAELLAPGASDRRSPLCARIADRRPGGSWQISSSDIPQLASDLGSR